jgi:hypothetical protein
LGPGLVPIGPLSDPYRTARPAAAAALPPPLTESLLPLRERAHYAELAGCAVRAAARSDRQASARPTSCSTRSRSPSARRPAAASERPLREARPVTQYAGQAGLRRTGCCALGQTGGCSLHADMAHAVTVSISTYSLSPYVSGVPVRIPRCGWRCQSSCRCNCMRTLS